MVGVVATVNHLGRNSPYPFLVVVQPMVWPRLLRRASARLTTVALEIKKGVVTRSEATIPLNRITDLHLHDGPLMRHYGLQGLEVETAGQSGGTGMSDSELVSVIYPVEFRDAVLRQSQILLDFDTTSADAPAVAGVAGLLTEIRDILARMEAGKTNN